MVTERAPPKAPLKPPKENNGRRLASFDDDDDDDDYDITSAIGNSSLAGGFASLKGSVRSGMDDPFSTTSSTSRPTFGHPTKMASSRKQKADPFIRQRTRPEHHLDDKRVGGPEAPAYRDRQPPALQLFNSIGPGSQPPVGPRIGDETFYTDPTKASADLKALLEGGMDDEEEEKGNKEKTDSTIQDGKDGTVEGLKVKLLPHQVEGVEWMRGRELGPVKRGKVPKGGILADDMGLGKTLQTISLILTNQRPDKDSKAWKKLYEGIEKTTLVVAPLALIRQWEAEIKEKVEQSHGVKVCVHHGPQRTKKFKDLAAYDVVVTTYQILVSEHNQSSDAVDGVKAGCFGLHWWRVVLDEAHTIKNRNAKATKACYALQSEYRWCLSGTPMQNNLDELQSLVKFLRIRPYDNLKEWKEHIDLPLKNGKGHIAINRLHSLLRCFMKRRTKEILKKDGALNPGGKPSEDGKGNSTGFKVTERKVVTVATELSPAERKFYDRLEARADRSLEAMMTTKVNYANALTLLLRLRQACNHPKLVEGKLEKDRDALSTGSGPSTSRQAQLDIDDMADMFAGMGLSSKSCSICGKVIGKDEGGLKRDQCIECYEDLQYFKSQGKSEKKPQKKAKVKKVVTKKVVEKKRGKKVKVCQDEGIEEDATPRKPSRRPRIRNAVLDSDDEEEEEAEGNWLVPEAERGTLYLGKAGGSEDENCEGGGESLGSEDSEDEEDESQSDLGSFIVDDATAKKEKGSSSEKELSDDNESLPSLDELTQAMEKQTLDEDSTSEADSSVADSSIADSSVVSSEDSFVIASQPVTNSQGSYATASQGTSSQSGSDTETNVASDSEEETEESDSGIDESELADSEDENGGIYDHDNNVLPSAKIRELVNILHKEVQQHKFIVFSQFTSMLDLVEPFFDDEGFRFVRYDGSMKNDEREESLRRLRTDDETRVLLCSLKCGSLGLNLTAATRVVILEPFWNPFIEEQAIDRVHRLTQTVDVIVYKLTVTRTVEERILDLQDKKRELAEQAIEGGMKKGVLKLGLNEIIDLFKPGHQSVDPVRGPSMGRYDRENSVDSDRSNRSTTMKKKEGAAPKKQESAIYGRRW